MAETNNSIPNNDKLLTFPLSTWNDGEISAVTKIFIYEYRNAFGSKAEVGDKNIDPIRRFSNADRTSVLKNATPQYHIFLPLPENLNDNNSVNYDNTSLGGLPETLSQVTDFVESHPSAMGGAGTGALIGGGVGSIFGAAGAGVGAALGSAAGGWLGGTLDDASKKAGIENMSKSTTGVDITDSVGFLMAGKAAMDVLGTSGLGNFSSLFELATGTVANPNLAVLFKGANLKQHSLSWKFIPESPEESQALKNIIRVLKRAMYPSQVNNQTAAFLKYPSELLVEFKQQNNFDTPDFEGNNNILYAMRPCVIADMKVDYSPMGTISLYSDFTPTIVHIHLLLQETSYATRDDFNNKDSLSFDGAVINLTERNNYSSSPVKSTNEYVSPSSNTSYTEVTPNNPDKPILEDAKKNTSIFSFFTAPKSKEE